MTTRVETYYNLHKKSATQVVIIEKDIYLSGTRTH